jgi:hypothetical protein
MKIHFSGILTMVLVFACTGSGQDYRRTTSNPEYLHRSLKAVTDRIVYDIFSPPVASRIYAYVTVAAYEAARNMNPDFVSLAGQLHGLDPLPKPDAAKEYIYPLASVHATLKVGKALVFSEDKIEEFYQKMMTEFRNTGIPEDVFDNSIEYGNMVADHILAWASKDNYKQSRSFTKYSIQSNPATWKPTPPAFMDAVEPHWNEIRTFVIDSASQFAPPPPTPFSTDKKSKFYKEALVVYETGKNLTEEQRMIASFWDCNPFVMNVRGHVMFATKKISPGGHWINITRVALTKEKADYVHSADAYVKVALSLADAFISCWDEKYRSNLVRPETYINQNIDENWTPLLQTPPFPEYTSGHSVISGSAAIALTKLFGDNYTFTDSTEVEFGMPSRSFTSFLAASEEATISRMYGGIHYIPACEEGKIQGRKVGNFIAEKIKTKNGIK